MHGDPVRSSSNQVLSHHRLRDAGVAMRIVASTGLAPPDLVVELGAGEGMLTAAVRERCRKVIAVEVDRSRWAELRRRFHDDPRVRPVLSDIVAFRFPGRGPYSVISNVPFSMTAALMRRLQELPNPPRTAYLVLQAGAAMKWAGLGMETKASVILKVGFAVEVILALRRTDFLPRPNVDCVLIRLTRRDKPIFSGREARAFEAFVRRGFNDAGRAPGRQARFRPGELSFEDWVAAFRAPQRRLAGAPKAAGPGSSPRRCG